FRLASRKVRFPFSHCARQARVLRLRELVSRSSQVPSRGKGLTRGVHTTLKPGENIFARREYGRSLAHSPTVLFMASMQASPPSLTLSRHQTINPSPPSEPPSSQWLATRSQWVATLALSHKRNSKRSLVPSKHRQSVSSRNQDETTNIESFRTFRSHTPDRFITYRSAQLTAGSTPPGSHAHGGPLTPSVASSKAYLHTVRQPSRMSKKLTAPSPSTHHSGQALLSTSRKATALDLTQGIHSDLVQVVDFTEKSATVVPKLFDPKAWAQRRNGWMIMFTSESYAATYMTTTSSGANGMPRLAKTVVDSTYEVEFGIEGSPQPEEGLRSLTRTAQRPSKTSQHPLRAQMRMPPTPTTCATFRNSQPFLVYLGKNRRTRPSDRKSATSVSHGTSNFAPLPFPSPSARSISRRLRNGKHLRLMTFRPRRNFTESSSTRPWSSQQDALFSPNWRPPWGLFTTVLSSHDTLPSVLVKTLYGGKRNLTHPSSDTSRHPFPSTTSTLSQTLAQRLASASLSAKAGEPGDSSQDGRGITETSDGQKQLASSYSSSPLSRLNQTLAARGVSSTVTTKESSKDGGEVVAETGLPTWCSGPSQPIARLLASRYTRPTSGALKTLQTSPLEASTALPITSSRPSTFQTPSDPTSSTSTHLLQQLSARLYQGTSKRPYPFESHRKRLTEAPDHKKTRLTVSLNSETRGSRQQAPRTPTP
ncbi:hypothetical protein BKA70DRAFT_1471193, partial [Coprinopsis sp. MPI-PUGE-AT-0042]